MALSADELKIIDRLSRLHDSEVPELARYDSYYEGTQPLSYMHPEILAEVSDRIRPLVIFWPQMAVDSIEERLRLEGFKTEDADINTELWRRWKSNRMVLGFRQTITDALVMRRAFVSVGTNPDDADTPIVTPESPLEVYVDIDPRTRRVRAALRRVTDADALGGVMARYATLYLPNTTIWCEATGYGGWSETQRDDHGLGMVPVAPVVYKPRLRSSTRNPRNMEVARLGRSALDPIIPLSDAANKLGTDMMVAAEFIATPLRALFGVGPGDFKDQDGNPMTPLRAMMGRLLTIPDEDVKAYEWASGQLANFTEGLRAMAELVVSVTGLPPHYLGKASDNPPSAEAIAASESRMATRAERAQDSLDAGAMDAAELILRFTKDWDPAFASMTNDWRNVRTPTVGAMADAAVKLFTTQPPIVPLRQTREKLGFDETEIEAMEQADEEAAARNPAAQIARGLADQRVPGDLAPANA
jgi:hypothetical protein